MIGIDFIGMIVAASAGMISVITALIFIYYSYKNALELKGAIGKFLTALGSVFFLMPGFLYAGSMEAGLEPVLRYVAFILFMMGLLLMLNGGVFILRVFYKGEEGKSPMKILERLPNGPYMLVGYTALIFVAFPSYMVSIYSTVRTIYGYIALVGVLICYSSFALGERKLYSKLTVSTTLEELPEQKLMLLKEDVYTLRLFTALTNDYLGKINQNVGEENLKIFFDSDELDSLNLFSSEVLDEYKLSVKKLKSNLASVNKAERIENICFEFGEILSKLVDFHARSTSIEYARSELENSFRKVRHQVGENPIIFDILRNLPEGVMEEEGYSLMSRQELESKVEKRTAELEKLMDTMVDTLVKIDSEGDIEMANDSFYDLLGYDEEEIKGSEADKIFAEEDSKGLNEVVLSWDDIQERIKREGYVKDLEVFYKTDKGKKIPISFSASLMDEGSGIVCVGKDITERKEAEDRAEFLHSLLRHDLGNKLQVTSGFLELLKGADLEGKERQFLEDSLNSVDEGIELIQNVRMLNRLDREEEIESIDLVEKVEESIERHRDLSSEVGIKINNGLKGSQKVEGGVLLKELFSNIIENSLNHSEGSRIDVSMEEKKEMIDVIVEDDGKGVPDNKKDDIFEIGSKGEDSSGSGLGMYLVRRIAEMYGGRIKVEDSSLGGAKFVVCLRKT
ncbi:MAG: PAS domain-containing sensor histidine kinase [Thermoplasmatota archaeon]